MDVQRLANQIYPALAHARECLNKGQAGMQEARAALEAAATLLRLHRPPCYAYYQPDRLFTDRRAVLEDDRRTLHVEPVKECAGDPEAVFACAAMLMRAAGLEGDAVLIAELFEGDEPLLALNIDGPGAFPDDIGLNGFFRLSLEEAGACWTLATRGGRLDKNANGLALRLAGMRMLPEQATAAGEWHDAVQRAAEFPSAATVDDLLAGIGLENQPPAPAEIGRLIGEVLDDYAVTLERRSIAAERIADAGTPPVEMTRPVMRIAFAAAIEYGLACLPRGGRGTVAVEYDPAACEASVLWSFTGNALQEAPPCWLAALRRAADLHGGTFDHECAGQASTLMLLLPDQAGQALAAWIPGMHRFSERSRQMLRLLKAQPGAVPEDVVLGGVLEEELQRWLGPCLETPLAANVAREVEPSAAPLAQVDMLKKALGRVAKGKPQKELTQPKYAAELLWAFRQSERGRRALGAQGLSQDEVESLCRALTEGPRADEALRWIARARDASGQHEKGD